MNNELRCIPSDPSPPAETAGWLAAVSFWMQICEDRAKRTQRSQRNIILSSTPRAEKSTLHTHGCHFHIRLTICFLHIEHNVVPFQTNQRVHTNVTLPQHHPHEITTHTKDRLTHMLSGGIGDRTASTGTIRSHRSTSSLSSSSGRDDSVCGLKMNN